MGSARGRLSEIRRGSTGQVEAFITCPECSIPQAGQYLLVSDPYNSQEVISQAVFPAEILGHGFWGVTLLPVNWQPGINLELSGPFGHGFALPRGFQRLGLIALDGTIARLMPLIHQSSKTRAGMSLYTDLGLPQLPAAVEVHPLEGVKAGLDWADFLVLDLPVERLEELRSILGLTPGALLPSPAQALVITAMPCGGLAQCGACAVPARRGWKLACIDGPVFDLNVLKW